MTEVAPKTRADARNSGAVTYFTGRPCKHGHVAARRTKDGRCRGCERAAGRSETARRAGKKYRATERGRAARRAYSSAAQGRCPQASEAARVNHDGRCAICGDANPGRRGWQVDHDHTTGAVRGVLCRSCNLGLGNFRDSPALLTAAAAYLEDRA